MFIYIYIYLSIYRIYISTLSICLYLYISIFTKIYLHIYYASKTMITYIYVIYIYNTRIEHSDKYVSNSARLRRGGQHPTNCQWSVPQSSPGLIQPCWKSSDFLMFNPWEPPKKVCGGPKAVSLRKAILQECVSFCLSQKGGPDKNKVNSQTKSGYRKAWHKITQTSIIYESMVSLATTGLLFKIVSLPNPEITWNTLQNQIRLVGW